MLDFLEQAEGRGRLAEGNDALAGGGTLACPILSTGGYGAEIEYQGTRVLINTGYGWSYELTAAELARKEQFYSIYWTTYHAEGNQEAFSESPDYTEEKNRFDVKA